MVLPYYQPSKNNGTIVQRLHTAMDQRPKGPQNRARHHAIAAVFQLFTEPK